MAAEENTTERWLPVVGFEGLYEVSDHGRVRSLPRFGCKGRILRPKIASQGYLWYTTNVGGVEKAISAHRSVLAAFVRPPMSAEEANHIDFDKANNRLENLEWLTHTENIRRTIAAGRNYTKLSHDDVRSIRSRHAAGESTASLARSFGISTMSVRRTVTRFYWKNVT